MKAKVLLLAITPLLAAGSLFAQEKSQVQHGEKIKVVSSAAKTGSDISRVISVEAQTDGRDSVVYININGQETTVIRSSTVKHAALQDSITSIHVKGQEMIIMHGDSIERRMKNTWQEAVMRLVDSTKVIFSSRNSAGDSEMHLSVGGKDVTVTVNGGKESVKTGDQLPDFTVKMFDGKIIDTRDLRGKVILINFWATWCGPCRKEFTRVPEEIVKRFEKEDFVFLPIARGDTDKEIAKFRQETGYEFPMGMDTDSKIFGLFAQSLIPRNYIVDRDGKIVWAEIGYTPEGFEAMVEKIASLLKAE